MTTLVRPFMIEDVVTGPPAATPSVHLKPTPKRVRCLLGDTVIADSTRAMLCFETNRLAFYYFPLDDVRAGSLVATAHTYDSPLKGCAQYFDVATDDEKATDAAWEYREPLPGGEPGTRYVAFHWNLMTAWFEEDEEVFVHPRDPYHRIDVLQSTRHVEVFAEGALIADTRAPRILFETHLPPRYYIPREDVRLDALETSSTRTACAYKGSTTQYWAVHGCDVAWCYATPPEEVGKVAGLIAFFNERVDIVVDGTKQPRPVTPWS